VDALVLALMFLSAALLVALLILVWFTVNRRTYEKEYGEAGSSEIQEQAELTARLQRVVDLLSSRPAAQGRVGEERLELILSSLPRRFWQRQPVLANGNRPDYLLQLGGELKVPLDSKLLGASDIMNDELSEPGGLDHRVERAAREVAQRYLEPSQSAPIALLVLPPGTHAALGSGALERCHGMGVVPTPAEGVAALALVLAHLTPWLPTGGEDDPANGVAATRRALATALELLERSGRQGRNSGENLERARQVLEGARVRLEAGEVQRTYGGRTPPLEELLS